MPIDEAPNDHHAGSHEAEELDRLATHLHVGVLVQGTKAEVLFANARAYELLGLTADELSQRTSFDPAWRAVRENGEPFPPEEHPPVVALRTGQPVADVVMGIFRPRSGDWVWLLLSSDPVHDDEGRVTQVVNTFTDITALKRAAKRTREALRAAEQFRDALDEVPAFVYMKDRESRYTYANAATLRLFGVSADALRGSPDSRFFSAEAVERLHELDRRVLAGERTNEEVEVAGPDGESRLYIEFKSPLAPVGDDPSAPGLLGISVDITERRSAVQRSQRLGAFYAALAQCYAAISRGVSQAELFETVCRTAVQVAGVRMAWIGMADEAAGMIRPVASFGDEHGYLDGLVVSTDPVDPRSQGPTGIAFREAAPFWLDDFRRDPRTTPWRERAERSGWVSSAAVPLFRRGAAVGALTMYATDTATFAPEVRRLLSDLARGIGLALDRIAAEEERARSEARLRLEGAALAAAANAIVIADREGRIESMNAACTAMTGFTEEEVVGRALRDLAAADRFPGGFFTNIRASVQAGKVWRGELVIRRKEGRLCTVEATITPVRDGAGAITHVVAVMEDVTERRALEEQFRQSQKMESVGRLAGGVAHDFNNMLSVILGRAELALTQVPEQTQVHDDLTEILAAGHRSADLTRQLLAFARKQAVSPKSIDLSAEVARSLKLLKRLISEDIRLTTALAPTVWPVFIDPSQLDQILANLCVNARDAIRSARDADPSRPNSDRVTITTGDRVLDAAFCAAHEGATPGDYVMLSVTDTGCGMSDEVKRAIFEPFFTTKAQGEGTGLGLSMVFGAAQQNGGFVTVKSAPGEGATFEVYLPRHRTTSPTSGTPTVVRPVGGTETILVVEDDSAVLHLTTMTLQRLGYTVLAAGSPTTALRMAQEHPKRIDLVLTDVIMPEMNGRALTEALRQRFPGLKRLFMSGYTADLLTGVENEVEERLLLTKPFTLAALAGKVREALDRG